MKHPFTQELIHQLVLQGVEYFCIAPGSRSTPLAVAIAENKRARTFVHFDERGLAFHALGYAIATGKPAALVVTSGTAVANLFPAVMEAAMSHIPLILLTADRPPELRDSGGNQTVDQVKIFGTFTRWQVDLPCSCEELPHRFLATTLGQAVYRATASPAGPVHINCMFREPFFREEALIEQQPPCIYEPTTTRLDSASSHKWAEHLSNANRGVIVVGSLPQGVDLKPLLALAEKLDWPIFADISSGLRSLGRHPAVVPHYDLILKGREDLSIEMLLQFGDRFVSKTLATWIKKTNPPLYCHISDHPIRIDPGHQITHRICANPASFAEAMVEKIEKKDGWLGQWQAESGEIEQRLLFSDVEISEAGLIRWLSSHVPQQAAFFFGNSMPVRDGETFFYPSNSCGPVFTQRGVSGIDGNIATIVGLSVGSQKPIIGLIGDQTALHDLNSVAQIKKSPFPILIFIINNGGGGIFSFLPVQQHTSFETFETYFANSHSFSFEHAAPLFHLPYYHPKSWEELGDVPLTESCIVELQTERARSCSLREHSLPHTLRER